MTMRPAIVIGLLSLLPGALAPVRAADPVRALAERLGLFHAGEPARCGLPLTAYVLDHAADVPAPGGIAPASLLDRAVLQTSVLRGRFRIHFDTTGTNEPALLDAAHQRIPGSYREYVDSVAAIAETVHRVETGDLGYTPPPPDLGVGGGEEYDIYLLNLDSFGYYGRTVPENPAGLRRSTTFIEIDNDFSFVPADTLKGLPAARVTIAHEYHHAIQLGSYGYWGFDNIFYYEMTSVWLEDAVFPEVNDYFSYLRSAEGHFRHPEVEFTSPGFIVYSRGIWCHYLARRYSPALIRRSWDLMASAPPLAALDAALQEAPYASSFRTAFAEWTLWNLFTGVRNDPGRYYPEGAWYPPVATRVSGFTPPAIALADALPPLSARYQQVLYFADTLTIALCNVNIGGAQAGETDPVPCALLVNAGRPDGSYRPTAAGLYVKLDVPDLSAWHFWDLVNGGVRPSPLVSGLPFPNPFRADGRSSVSVQVPVTSPVQGTLVVFTPDMNRVATREGMSSLLLGNYVFSWDGRTDEGDPAATGVYLFVLELPDRRISGKFALIRE